jgi:phenylpropionate dioxygenase-like ring-hydroxylating dioxygenase large terminal subunit
MDASEYRFLHHVWFPVARADEAASGVVHGRILDTDLVIYTAAGTTTVAQGYCPHRGMALWRGEIVGNCLECPYHGWQFASGTGTCERVPSLPDDNPAGRSRLRVFPVREAYGHVWSCLSDPYLPLPVLPSRDQAGWQFAYGNPHDLNCGMRQLTENFRDISHFAFVHRGTMGPSARRVVDRYTVSRSGWDIEWVMRTNLGGTALSGNSAVAGQITLTHRVSLPMAATVETQFPSGARRFLAQFATPISRDGLKVRQFWTLGIDLQVIQEHGVSIDEMWDYERRIFEEDYPIVENQWPQEAPLDVHSQDHCRADRYSIVYRRAYSELLEAFTTDEDLSVNINSAQRTVQQNDEDSRPGFT